MQKIVFCAMTALVAHFAFGAYAWFSSEINAILARADFPEKYRTLDTPVKLYGSFSGNYWTPPNATVDSMTGAVKIKNNIVITVSDFFTLNNYGQYDPSISVGHYADNCKEYLTDEFGQKYWYYSEEVAAFYTKYESLNITAVANAFDQLKAKFSLYVSSIRTQTEGQAYDASKLAEKIKEIDSALDSASEQIAETAKAVENRVSEFNQSIAEVQDKLLNVSNEAVADAQRFITKCVDDFSSFVNSLEEAIESGDMWKEAAEDAYSELSESEKNIIEAIENLYPYIQDPDVASAYDALYIQQKTISGIKTSLRQAIDNSNKSALGGILNRAKNAGIINTRKAMKRIDNAAKTYQSQSRVLSALQSAAIRTSDYLKMIDGRIEEIRSEFNKFLLDTMDNFHQINAYLASTNSMMYLDKRKTAGTIKDFTTDELERWAKISTQDPLFRDEEDENNYEIISRLGMFGGSTYNTIFRLIGSTYFMTYMDIEWMDRFMNTYDNGGFRKQNIRGFYADEEIEGKNTVTNWYAGHITAPKNWADGKTIIVTNGHYVAVGGSGARVDNASITTNEIYGAIANGDASIYGFSTAENGNVPYKTAGGRVGWVTNSVDGGGLLMLKTGEAPSTVDIIAGYGMKVTKQSGAIQISSTLDTPDSAGAFSSITYISNIEYDTETHSLKVTKTTVSAKILNDGTSQEQTVFIATPHSAEHPSELE